MEMKMKFYFFTRLPGPGDPGGITVSKHETLPAGEFRITEYYWPHRSLWFVDSDKFTANERQAAHMGEYEKP